jgi:hypothetical protein
LTGQLGAARASLELLADRASDPKRPWPEFSEYSCFACHHGLKDDAWRRNGAKQQLWNWSPWAFAFRSEWQQDPSDDAQLSDLVKLMGSPAPDRAIVAKQARLYANHLAQVVTQTEQTPLNFPRVSELLRSLNAAAAWQGDRSWDQSAQRYLALVALLQTWRKMETGQSAQQADFERALDHRKAQLVFPAGFDSPRDFVPGSLQTVPER